MDDWSLRRWRRASAAIVPLAATGLLGWAFGSLVPTAAGPPVLADSSAWPPRIEVRKAVDRGHEFGELLVNGEIAIQLRGETEKLTPYERVVVVAERLKAQVKPREETQVSTGLIDGEHVVLVNGAVIVTAVAGDVPEGMTLREAAQAWAESLADALGVELVAPQEPRPWQPDEPYEDKIVPILSFGKGKQVGAARVNGPATAVAQTQAVVQIEARMLKWFEVQIYVPVSTRVPGENFTRVPGVAVTAVGDFRL